MSSVKVKKRGKETNPKKLIKILYKRTDSYTPRDSPKLYYTSFHLNLMLLKFKSTLPSILFHICLYYLEERVRDQHTSGFPSFHTTNNTRWIICAAASGEVQSEVSSLIATFFPFALCAALRLAWIWRTYSATMTWNFGASLFVDGTLRPAFFKAFLIAFWATWKWWVQREGTVDLSIGFPQVRGPAWALDI